MKIWTRIVLLTAIAAGPSLADDLHDKLIIRNDHGRVMGIVERDLGNDMIRSDAPGRRVGSGIRVVAASRY